MFIAQTQVLAWITMLSNSIGIWNRKWRVETELLLCHSWIGLQGGGVVVTNSAADLAFHLIMCILSLLKTWKNAVVFPSLGRLVADTYCRYHVSCLQLIKYSNPKIISCWHYPNFFNQSSLIDDRRLQSQSTLDGLVLLAPTLPTMQPRKPFSPAKPSSFRA